MKKFSFSILVLVCFCYLSCENSENCCINVDNTILLHYINKDGKDLINSSPEYAEDNIKIYYQKQGEFIYAYQPQLDHPNMFDVISGSSNELLLKVFASNQLLQNTSVTLVKLNENISDTLVTAFDLSNGNQVINKIWINGELKENGIITMVK